MDLFNEDFEAIEDENDIEHLPFPGKEILPSDIGVTLTENKNLIDTSDEPMILPLSEIGSLLEGFEFSGYKTLLYISGSRILDNAKIDITFEEKIDEETYTPLEHLSDVDFDNEPSSFEDWKENGYDETDCPLTGVEIDVPLEGKDIAISFKVYIPAGETLTLDDFEEGNINVEVVVWLPFVFEAVDEGASIAFPDGAFFDSEDDLFGREEAGDGSTFTDIVESLSVDVKFQNNPFMGADLLMIFIIS